MVFVRTFLTSEEEKGSIEVLSKGGPGHLMEFRLMDLGQFGWKHEGSNWFTNKQN